MALVVNDRVQESTTTAGTGSITLGGAVAGFQSFAIIGNGNTTFYCIIDTASGAWEVGLGTYSTAGPTLARTTILSNSNGNTSPITLSSSANTKSVFVTYPSEKSVNLDASGNVTALGTITSAVWNGTTIPVAYGGTGVTASSGANSVVLRDTNQNVTANNFFAGYTSVTSAAGTTVLTAASSHFQRLTGTTTQTFQLPDATTVPVGAAFIFDNDSTGVLTIIDNASGVVDTVEAGALDFIFLEAAGSSAGSWGKYSFIPGTYDFSISTASFGNATITNAVWNGTTIASGYGGTGLTTFTAANNALYSTSAGALTAGTLPIAAGGTGATTSNGALTNLGAAPAVTYTTNYVPYGQGTTTPNQNANFTFNGTTLTLGNAGVTARFQGDFSNATVASRTAFITGTTNGSTGIYALPNGTSTAASWQATNNSNPTNASKILIATNGSTDVQLVSGINGTGTYLPLSFYTNGSQKGQINLAGDYTAVGNIIAQNGIIVNATTLVSSFTIPSGSSASSVGGTSGFTIPSGLNVTVSSGGRWVIL